MWSCVQIPRSSEGKEWFYYTDQSVTLELLEGTPSHCWFVGHGLNSTYFVKCHTQFKIGPGNMWNKLCHCCNRYCIGTEGCRGSTVIQCSLTAAYRISVTDCHVWCHIVAELTQEFLEILDKCPSKLKRKILTYKVCSRFLSYTRCFIGFSHIVMSFDNMQSTPAPGLHNNIPLFRTW